jgi:hypothetical protein
VRCDPNNVARVNKDHHLCSYYRYRPACLCVSVLLCYTTCNASIDNIQPLYSTETTANSSNMYKVYLRYQEFKKRSTSCVHSGSIRSNAKHDKITTYHQMLVGVSILDIMYSFWAASGVISVPSTSGDVLAHGTIATCSTQIFLCNWFLRSFCTWRL